MFVNPDKFQAIVLKKGNKNINTTITLSIQNITINTSKLVKLLEVTIDNRLKFEEHISVFCKKQHLYN